MRRHPVKPDRIILFGSEIIRQRWLHAALTSVERGSHESMTPDSALAQTVSDSVAALSPVAMVSAAAAAAAATLDSHVVAAPPAAVAAATAATAVELSSSVPPINRAPSAVHPAPAAPASAALAPAALAPAAPPPDPIAPPTDPIAPPTDPAPPPDPAAAPPDPAPPPPAAPPPTAPPPTAPPPTDDGASASAASSSLSSLSSLVRLARMIRRGDHVVFVTGSGLSAPSGIPTFRGEGGVWARFVLDWGTRQARYLVTTHRLELGTRQAFLIRVRVRPHSSTPTRARPS